MHYTHKFNIYIIYNKHAYNMLAHFNSPQPIAIHCTKRSLWYMHICIHIYNPYKTILYITHTHSICTYIKLNTHRIYSLISICPNPWLSTAIVARCDAYKCVYINNKCTCNTLYTYIWYVCNIHVYNKHIFNILAHFNLPQPMTAHHHNSSRWYVQVCVHIH